MEHYNYQKKLEELWLKAVKGYQDGARSCEDLFTDEEAKWLYDNGITKQEIYDFAEDYNDGAEPDFATFAMVQDVRRSFFFDVMDGQFPPEKVNPGTYPPKSAEVDGIVWLPRIIEKAKAKLHGALDPDTMYGCGGDRKFLRTHDIHPAEFLRKVAQNLDDTAAVIDWVKTRSAEAPASV